MGCFWSHYVCHVGGEIGLSGLGNANCSGYVVAIVPWTRIGNDNDGIFPLHEKICAKQQIYCLKKQYPYGYAGMVDRSLDAKSTWCWWKRSRRKCQAFVLSYRPVCLDHRGIPYKVLPQDILIMVTNWTNTMRQLYFTAESFIQVFHHKVQKFTHFKH